MLVDTAIVGRLGTAQLGGLALAATVLSFVVAGCNFLTYGTTERVARRLGAGDRPGAADVGVQAMWLSVLVGVPAAVLLVVGARTVCRLLGGVGRRARLRRRLPADQCRRRAVRRSSRSPPRACCAGAADYRTPLVDPVRVEPRQRRARGRVRVRARPGRARLGVVDGDRPGRRRASPSSSSIRAHLVPAVDPPAAIGRGWRRC